MMDFVEFRLVRRAARIVPLAVLLAAPFAAAQQNQIFDPRNLAPYVPTPQRIVEQMLEVAGVNADDIVYDIGSGDGRILIAAAEDFKAKAVGIEINPTLVRETEKAVKALGIADRVRVIQGDALETDLSEATVVTVYLLTSSNETLKPKLERELKAGARVVSHDFKFTGWRAAETVEAGDGPRRHRIYLYRMGEHLAEQ
jgi:precorrin-6B methylase 2